MCLQCVTDSVWISEFAPGWHLMLASQDSPMGEWMAGQYGVTRMNDPHFIVDLKWFDEITSENIDEYSDLVMDFYEQSKIDPKSGYDLYSALQQIKIPYGLKRYWIKNMINGFNGQFYTYLAWLAKEYKHD